MTCIHPGDMQVTNKNGEIKAASENGMPVSSYMSHGSRVMIEIPPNTADKLMNWISNGDKSPDTVKNRGDYISKNQKEALQSENVLYKRDAATHGVDIKKAKDGFKLKEKKGFLIGLRDYITNKLSITKTKHFGMDLALNKNPGKERNPGADGEHGHLYIHYVAPTKNKPGAMLVGVEGYAPNSKHHSKTGASNR